VSFAACKSSDGGGSTAAPAATGAAPAAAVGDVMRYATGEVADTGSYTAWQAVKAHKAADPNSEGVMILQPGSSVQRVVRYGAFTLVQWGSVGGMKQGWVETSQMIRPILYDAGTGTTPFGASNFGSNGQGVGATPTKPTAPTTKPLGK
jgi:hypothetical protein